MERSWLGLILLGGICFSGCGTSSPPPVVTPPASNGGTETTATTVNVPPETKPVTPPPKLEPPKAAADEDLRKIAAHLVEPTGDGGWRIGESAALELERLGPEAPAKLLPLMADEQLEVRRGAAFHLLSSFDPASPEQVAAFSRLLADQDATIRSLGLNAVKQMRTDDVNAAQPQLIALLSPAKETKPENRAAVARFAGSLRQQGVSFSQSLATAAVDDPDERVRSAAIIAITQVAKPEESVPTLAKGLADSKPNVRLVAAVRLRILGPLAVPAVDSLGKSLADEDERVRTAAAEALSKMGILAVPTLSAQLSSPDVNARKLALACLAGLGTAAKSELAKIEKLQQDPDVDVREAAKTLAERLKQ